jgi:hypothetical protein
MKTRKAKDAIADEILLHPSDYEDDYDRNVEGIEPLDQATAARLVASSSFFERPEARTERSRTEQGESELVELGRERSESALRRWLRREADRVERDVDAAFGVIFRDAADAEIEARNQWREIKRLEKRKRRHVAAGRAAWNGNLQTRRELAYRWVNAHPRDFAVAEFERRFVAAFTRTQP